MRILTSQKASKENRYKNLQMKCDIYLHEKVFEKIERHIKYIINKKEAI